MEVKFDMFTKEEWFGFDVIPVSYERSMYFQMILTTTQQCPKGNKNTRTNKQDIQPSINQSHTQSHPPRPWNQPARQINDTKPLSCYRRYPTNLQIQTKPWS
jgi:hypothetical protein